MSQYIIFAQSDATARALGAWLEMVGEPSLKPELHDDSRVIIHKGQNTGGIERGVLAYEHLVRRIEKSAADATGSFPLNEIVVLVDAVNPSALNPLAEGGGWNSLIAMLILTFPEIRWVFGVGAKNNELEEYHSLMSLLAKPRRDPLFDATGLRDCVRRRINENLPVKNFPIRIERAAAIDEETNYALFHAYIAFRFGYRADAVRSWSLMHYLFNLPKDDLPEAKNNNGHKFQLLLEDVNLNFPDKPGRIHLSTFQPFTHKKDGKQGRAEHCNLLSGDPLLETSRFRVIVTSGHSGADREKMQDNVDFVKGYKSAGGHEFVLKPVGGMFDLWDKSQLFLRLDPRKGHEYAGTHRGQAPGFHWPPEAGEDAEGAGGHSAPGKLMVIAHNLVRRADRMKDLANTVEECIRGAVLATEALELLRYQTPTLALQALCLKHEFEVRAEVAFLGVGNHFALKPRLSELEREVKVASQFFQKNRRIAAELDTLVSIGNRLMLIFREAGQFDEELECLARIRKWHRKLRLRHVDNPFKKSAQFVMYYAEWLLESPGRFIWAIIGWFLAFWLTLNIASFIPEFAPILSLDKVLDIDNASTAWNVFISNNPGGVNTIPQFVINAAATTVGIFHLGVFISYLYSAVTRK
ncbi:MAG: hypothetical protein JJE30_11105 [Desulfuromonadales bacterium]|nr:hypothetical protein [Desulfuromonadales bacterium]